MTKDEILSALEGLKELTNDNGKRQIDGIKAAVQALPVVAHDGRLGLAPVVSSSSIVTEASESDSFGFLDQQELKQPKKTAHKARHKS